MNLRAAEFVTITPEIAAQMLSASTTLNPRSPAAHSRRVQQYAAAMSRGEWRVTGEPIICNGKDVLNGHTRLAACVKSNVPFETLLVRGIDKSALPMIDIGKPRSAGDTLHGMDVKNANLVASITRQCLALEADKAGDRTFISIHVSKAQIVDLVASSGDHIESAVHVAQRTRRFRGTVRTAAGTLGLYILRHDGDFDLYSAFIDQLASGEGLRRGDPALALSQWLSNPSGTRASAEVTLSAFIRAWNHVAQGASVTVIRPWSRGATFPEVALS